MKRNFRRGFTLIELLVVMSIIILLISIIMPALGKARERGRRAKCSANLRAIGHAIYIYATTNNDYLIPGNCNASNLAWGPETDNILSANVQPVNLGILLNGKYLPFPADDDNVVFCPSINQNKSKVNQRAFEDSYGTITGNEGSQYAPVGYMFNDSLDGFNNHILTAEEATLNFSHKDRIQFLKSDGSVHSFAVEKLEYEIGYKETIQEVCSRYNIAIPSALLHKWLKEGEVDLDEARAFLLDCQVWADANCSIMNGITVRNTMKPVKMARLEGQSLVCDVTFTGSPGSYVRPPGEEEDDDEPEPPS